MMENEEISASPLLESQFHALKLLAKDLSKTQRAWVSGYFYGLDASEVAHHTPAEQVLTILFGTQTGNAQNVAEALAQSVGTLNRPHRIRSLADYQPGHIERESQVVLVVSTYGEGEPTDSTKEFYDYLHSKRAKLLPNLNYIVIGLGDSSYDKFCQTAVDLDRRLTELGARPMSTRFEFDVDYQTALETMVDQVSQLLKKPVQGNSVKNNTAQIDMLSASTVEKKNPYGKINPFEAIVLGNARITTDDAVREVRHLELGINASLVYQPGDTVVVRFENDPVEVDKIIERVESGGAQGLRADGTQASLIDALRTDYEISRLPAKTVKAWAEFSGNETLTAMAKEPAKLRQAIQTRQLIHLLREFPGQVNAEQLQRMLVPMQSRQYSIASGPEISADEIHLTVGLIADEVQGRMLRGGASNYLSRLVPDQTVRLYVVKNSSFRLPKNRDAPVIMVAAGTGIAPFRAFMQERMQQNGKGGNWLLFGNRHFERDFLYQAEWLKLVKSGTLDKLNIAFSRDSGVGDKYVQHVIASNAKAMHAWIEEGAYLYVCGSVRMGESVELALKQVIMKQGDKSEVDAMEYLSGLNREGRLNKELY